MSEQGLHLEHNLQQTIGPQLQQSLHILQVPSVELQQLIRIEIEQNPTLEDASEELSLDEIGLGEEGFDDATDSADDIDADWSDFLDNEAPIPAERRADEDDRRQFMFDSLVAHPTLQGHLREQIALAGAPRPVTEATEILLGEMNDEGFLETPLEDLCLSLAVPMADLKQAKQLINSLDPPGVGASDLRESLIIQLERRGLIGSLPYRIVDQHLALLAKRRFSEIARALGCTTSQVIEAQETISCLDPHPAREFSSQPTIYIRPDVLVTEDRDGDFIVRLTGESIPDLKISSDYLEVLAQSDGDPEARSYIKEKIRNGKFLIRSIQQRQQTIQRITAQIVIRQREFLREGPDRLHPMNMAEIAQAIGVHETTVSRAVAGKYMRSAQGLHELRFFFSAGYQRTDGESVSNIGVKNTIAELIAEEDPAHPLSDQKIVKLLDKKGIPIARRTVAKYRDALHIIPSHLRRRS